MTTSVASSRPFEPGSTGWTAHDLDDPQIEAKWFGGRFEIVEGVLTKMPPAYFSGGYSLLQLVFILKTHLRGRKLPDKFATEVDLVMAEDRVVIADAAWLKPEDELRQVEAARLAGKADPARTRILVPPTLVIESMSPGHESHDFKTKRRWYAEFGVGNYWVLDAFSRTLECLVLEGGAYRIEATGRRDDQIRTALFPDLIIPLRDLWEE